MRPKVALRMVVVSPSDVEEQVSSLQGVIREVNRTLELAGRNLVLEMAHWKTDVHPGFHVDGPQALIDSILRIEQADILLAIFWKRMGSAGAGGTSGTEHEIRLACQAASVSGKPHITLYFSQAPYTPKSVEEIEQWGGVLRFKEEFHGKAVYAEYMPETFKDDVRSHLLGYLFTHYPATLIPEISAMAVPAVVTGECITEKMGDVFLTFNGYTPGTYDIRLFLNTEITNRIGPDKLTDAYLQIDSTMPPVFGKVISLGGLVFSRVPIDAPQLHVRIEGVRCNGTRFIIARGPRFSAPIFGTLSIQPSDAMIEPTTIGPSLIVAFVKSGFAFRVWSGNNLSLPLQISRAEGVNPTLLANVNAHDADATLFLQFFELLPTAFKTAAEEGSGADCGTRFRVEFNCLPEDVRVFVTTRDMPMSGGNAARAVLVSSEYDRVSPTMSSAATSATNVGGVPAVEVPLQNGRGTAIWEWISTDVASLRGLEELVFGIAVSALAGGWIVGSALIGGTLAPTINYPITVRDFRASTDAPVPRFVNVSQSIHAISFVP